MLHYRDRSRRIFILTLDRILATDVYERLSSHSALATTELIRPVAGESEIAVEDVARLSRETTTARVLIIDVRRQTKPSLQRAYSDIVRFNRPDFNRYCFSVLIGDGPVGLLTPGRSEQALAVYLSDLRVDYSPAVFFSNPFLHYSYDETQHQAIFNHNAFPQQMPHRLEKYFKHPEVSVERMCRYWRAADVPETRRERTRQHRQKRFRKLCQRILRDEASENAGSVETALAEQGYALPGESLRINLYPFHFAQWVVALMRRAESAARASSPASLP
jgi:hypothetical protein